MPDPGPAALDPAAASQVIQLLNTARASVHLPPLHRSASLDAVARSRITAALRARAFGHVLPGEEFVDRFIGAVPPRWLVGEVMDIASSPEDAARLFLASPSHSRLVLSPSFTDIGAAAARCAWGLLVIADLAGPSALSPQPIPLTAHAATSP
jgi:uncharacterized protein YkwD